MAISLQDALNLLKTDPRALLDNAFVPIAGGDNTSTSKAAIFSITKPPLEQDLYQRLGTAVPTFRIQVLQNAVMYPAKFTDAAGDEHLTFTAFYIAMKPMATVAGQAPAGTHFVLPATGGGSELCITSQLSGCTFGIGSQAPGGCCLVSHIQPVGPLATAQGAMAAQTQALFGAAPRKLVQKGAANDYVDRAHVIGKRSFGHWDFFMQPFTAGHARVLQPVVDL